MTSIRFGTDGWRAIIAEDFTFANVRAVVCAIARYLKKQGKGQHGVVVGYDTRFLSDAFAREAACVLDAHGIPVLMVKRPTPTPLVAFAVVYYGADGAIMFTASHNPPQYNGIKFIPDYGGPATPDITRGIEAELPDALREAKTLRLPEARARRLSTCGRPTCAILTGLSIGRRWNGRPVCRRRPHVRCRTGAGARAARRARVDRERTAREVRSAVRRPSSRADGSPPDGAARRGGGRRGAPWAGQRRGRRPLRRGGWRRDVRDAEPGAGASRPSPARAARLEGRLVRTVATTHLLDRVASGSACRWWRRRSASSTSATRCAEGPLWWVAKKAGA